MRPVSSASSRRAASTGRSPSSTKPPGSAQQPMNGSVPRRMSSTRRASAGPQKTTMSPRARAWVVVGVLHGPSVAERTRRAAMPPYAAHPWARLGLPCHRRHIRSRCPCRSAPARSSSPCSPSTWCGARRTSRSRSVWTPDCRPRCSQACGSCRPHSSCSRSRKLRGASLRRHRRELRIVSIVGLLLLVGGQYGMIVAEQYIASGIAALIVALVPLWIALAESAFPTCSDRARSAGSVSRSASRASAS